MLSIDFLSLFYLIPIVVFVYFLFSFVLNQSSVNAHLFLTEEEKDHKRRSGSLFKEERKNPLIKFSPSHFLKAAHSNEWYISSIGYSLLVFVASAISCSILYILQFGIFSALGSIVGLMIPRLMLSFYRVRYKRRIEENLILYMKTLSNAVAGMGSVVNGINTILPVLPEPIKSDVNQALSILHSGKTVEEAFKAMNQKYNYKDLRFFHSMLHASHVNGAEFYDSLMTTADDFEQKKVLQAKLSAAMTQSKRAFIQSSIIMLLIILGFAVLVSDLFETAFSTLIGKLVLLYIFASTLFIYSKVQEHSEFDPSELYNK